MASLGAWHLATLPHAAASRRTATLPCAPSVHPSSIPARHLVTSVTCAAATPAAGTGNGNGGGPNGARPPRPSNSGYLSFEDSFERRRRQDVEDETEALGDPNFSEKLLKGEQILQSYLSGRVRQVAKHFPDALGVDDFIARMEVALYAYGFNGDNTIACSNLCRDEVTATLKDKLDAVFGSSFNTNGLGGVLTCGVTGLKAGLSHAPVSVGSGKERYVFFSFPHIGIDACGTLGNISRPGRPGASSACGAIKAALSDIRGKGLAANCMCPGVHEARDPEYSILKQRLARRMRYEGTDEADVQKMDLVDLTKVAERTITDDLEYLIQQSVDTNKADYAVVTGVQIHNWGAEFDDESPNLEFVWPCSIYVVIRGERTYLDVNSIPGMTPRQIEMLAAAAHRGEGGQGGNCGEGDICGSAGNQTTVRAIDPPYMYSSRQHRRELRRQAESYQQLMQKEQLEVQNACAWPSWQATMRAQAPFKAHDDNSTIIDEIDERAAATSFEHPEEASATPPAA